MVSEGLITPVDRLMTSDGSLILTKSGNDLVLTKSTDVIGNVVISDVSIDNMNSSLTVETDNTIDLGSSSKKFRNIYGHILVGDMSGDDWTHSGAMRITPVTAGATTLTISNSGAGNADLNLSDGALQTGGTERLSNAGALSNITTITSSGAIKNQADGSGFYTGTGDDLRIYHSGSHSFIDNTVGHMYIRPTAGSLIVEAETGVNMRVKGSVQVQDRDDGNVSLFNLDTTARTLTIGQAADPIAMTINGTSFTIEESIQFLASSSLQKDTQKPARTETEGVNYCYATLDYSATASEEDDWSVFIMPANYGGGNITAKIAWYTSDNTAGHQVRWELKYDQFTTGGIIDGAMTTVAYSADVHATANDIQTSTVTSSLTLTAGQHTAIRIRRDHDHADDDCTADAKFVSLELSYNT